LFFWATTFIALLQFHTKQLAHPMRELTPYN